MEMGEQRATVLLARIESIVREMESFRERMQKDLEPQVLELSREIAERIVMEELSVRPEVMVNIVKEAMRKLERTGPITIKLNPAVHDLFMRLKPQLLEVHPDIIFDVDPSLTPHGQVVVGATEEVVTDIASQVRNIMEDIGADIGDR
jgi:flagellar biosynthesis/type III secretory pathway protein FliH